MSSSTEQTPATDAAKLTITLAEKIAERGGWMGFDEFMQQALYHPRFGYYSGRNEKIGEQGDFITAPELGNFFAHCLANQCAQILKHENCNSIYEFGAGKGTLAADIIRCLEQQNTLPDHYYIFELSSDLITRQQQTINSLPNHLSDRVQWLSRLPETFNGCIIANELLDAIPCLRFEINAQSQPRALGVSFESGSFHWQVGNHLDKAIITGRSLPTIAGYQSEICLQAESWVSTIGERLEKGIILLVDYGFPKSEFYHPERSSGTLMCHIDHRAHTDPFFLPGGQDITTHIDFSAIARAGIEIGLVLTGYTDQANFLMSCNLLNMVSAAQRSLNTQQMLERTAEVKKLILPHEMGELFKVVAFSQGIADPLLGFTRNNKVGALLS